MVMTSDFYIDGYLEVPGSSPGGGIGNIFYGIRFFRESVISTNREVSIYQTKSGGENTIK